MHSQAAIERYHQLLHDQPALAQESANLLRDRQPDLHLTFGDRVMCTSLRPQLIGRDEYAHIQRVCASLAMVGSRLEQVLLGRPDLLAVLDLDEHERRLVETDPGFSHPAAATRLDSFVTADSWQFVEYNAESPAGMGYVDLLSELFLELPIMRQFERATPVHPLPTRASMLSALLRAYQEWGGAGNPTIAIVDWGGLPTAAEFEIFRRFFTAHGHRTLIVDPRELEFQDGRLRAEGVEIDIVYRRVLTHELLAHPDDAQALLQAYEARAVCVVNAFRCKLLHKKAIFAVLSDDANAGLFSVAEQEIIRRHIPWTRKVYDGRTTYQGRGVDLCAHILAHKEQLVLKPNDEYGGKGVVLGWETPATEWEAALRTALAASYVVQERVPTTQHTYPVWEDGTLRMVDLIVDLDPYVFAGQVHGMLTRISSSSLLNVTAGAASTIPTFIVDEG
ncbi:MAG TPA: circularly permuted type 2 ATP-grasp protein [Chloroflexota bacterium]|nr:circularly permuted type 2 ATP-grasp protein [Chloroflexota bacterium]